MSICQTIWKNKYESTAKTLNFHNNTVYYQDQTTNLSVLLAMFLEESLGLSHGFKAIYESNCLNAKKAFVFFAEPMIQDSLKSTLLKSLVRLKANHRKKEDIYEYTKKDFNQELIDKISFGCTSGFFNYTDMQFWLSFPLCFENWKKAYISSTLFARLSLTSNLKINVVYKPWLVLIRRRLLEIENQDYAILRRGRSEKLDEKIQILIQWIFKKPRRGFIKWIIPFLFNENWRNTKRKFLYIRGPPNSGKTFFMKTLFPISGDFQVKNRTFTYFSNDSPGDYDLHLLVFDDPGECQNRNNQLEPSVLLNLANYNPGSIKHALPVKYGFMNIVRGQVVIISNRPYRQMFSKNYHESIKSRLQVIKITSPIPIRVSSAESKLFQLREMPLDDEEEEDDDNVRIEDDGIEEEDNDDDDEEEDDDENENEGEEEFINEDLLFYLMWRAILKILKIQLQVISSEKLSNYIPNPKLIRLIRDQNYDSLYPIICHILSEKDLFKLVCNDEE
ncbi:MAG: hypothetical protein EOO99_11795 [Pedobacter sp.]|nr:MAG: hypothetical protein EOO99_11795 [Pedobacter sp.]